MSRARQLTHTHARKRISRFGEHARQQTATRAHLVCIDAIIFNKSSSHTYLSLTLILQSSNWSLSPIHLHVSKLWYACLLTSMLCHSYTRMHVCSTYTHACICTHLYTPTNTLVAPYISNALTHIRTHRHREHKREHACYHTRPHIHAEIHTCLRVLLLIHISHASSKHTQTYKRHTNKHTQRKHACCCIHLLYVSTHTHTHTRTHNHTHAHAHASRHGEHALLCMPQSIACKIT